MKKRIDLKHLVCLSVSAATVLSVGCLTFADGDLPEDQPAVVEETDDLSTDNEVTDDQTDEPEAITTDDDFFTEEGQEFIEEEIIDEPEIVFEDASEVSASGEWEQTEDGRLRYKENGSYVYNDWREIGGKTYHFDYSGYATTGSFIEDDQFYIFDYDGIMQTGWCQYNGNWFYLNPTTGAAYRGWQTIGGKKYYFNDYNYNPYMYADMISQINGEYYKFGKNGVMLTGFQKYDEYEESSYICYFDPDNNGAMVKGWKKIDGKYYYFADYSGSMYKNTFTSIDDKYYYFGEDGSMKTGWQSETDYNGTVRWYYFTTKGAYTGWHKISGKWYYFYESTGSYTSKPYMYTGTKNSSYQIDGKNYCFDENGVMQTGWVDKSPSDGYHSWYYYDPETGAAVTGWKSIGGKWYYFSDSGLLWTGYGCINGSYYYFDSDGIMQKNVWLDLNDYSYYKISGNSDRWLYFGSDGKAVTGWNQIGGKWYYFNPIVEEEYGDYSRPTMLTGLTKINNDYYFFDTKTGVMLTGWQCEDNGSEYKTWFYFSSNGKAVTGWQKLGGKWYHFEEITAETYGDYTYYNQPYMDTGIVYINGKNYFFDSNGVMQTGWNKCDGRYVYADKDGVVITNDWLHSGGKWYYFNYSGFMAYDGYYVINGKVYQFDKNGVCKNP